MLLAFTVREKLLHLLPKGGDVAEIGSFQGDFAQQILDIAKPSHLHLIDPWGHQTRADYQCDESNLPDGGHEENLKIVKDRFAGEIEEGRVILHRDYSYRVAKNFEDHSFDWIYIDGMHTHDAVLGDLTGFEAKVKPSGLILGHDYANYAGLEKQGYGVVEAVDEFIQRSRFDLVALTAEGHATFLLGDMSSPGTTELVLSRIIYNIPAVTEIMNYSATMFRQKVVEFPDRESRLLTSFNLGSCGER